MPVIITKPGVIPEAKQKELSAAGYVVVEASDPKDIVVMDETPSLDRDLLLSAAIDAIGYGNDQSPRLAFGDLIRKRLYNKK